MHCLIMQARGMNVGNKLKTKFNEAICKSCIYEKSVSNHWTGIGNRNARYVAR